MSIGRTETTSQGYSSSVLTELVAFGRHPERWASPPQIPTANEDTGRKDTDIHIFVSLFLPSCKS